jgi:glycosyltransferase involved in cell wall biosynthesis
LKRICIITPNYISGSPRTVKEADALCDAGFDVTVVFTQGQLEQIRDYDDELVRAKKWQTRTIGWSCYRREEKFRYHSTRFRHFVARNIFSNYYQSLTASGAYLGRTYFELLRLTGSIKADLYIAHYPQSLPVALNAAKKHDALIGYDAEDFHTEEGTDSRVQAHIKHLEGKILPRCVHVTATSSLIADRLASKYGIERPVPVHNVFPWAERAAIDGQTKDRRGEALSLYWYSQTIGLNRGIQDAIQAAGLVNRPIQIHLRGTVSDETQTVLSDLARACGVADRLFFHSRVSPHELISRAVEHDIGLALEHPVDTSRQISVTNKLFHHLLAGLCLIATDVPGQRYVLEASPEVGYLYAPGDVAALAAILQSLADNPELLQRHKAAALEAARTRWNWEIESQHLVNSVRQALGQAAQPSLTRIN